MPTDFGISGSRNYRADLANIDEQKARSLLLDIKAQITGTSGVKSGVLKLVNLESPDRNIALERKHILQRMWQRDGADMTTTANTLKSLFEKAGFSAEIRNDLASYLERRSDRAGTRSIDAFIARAFTELNAVSGVDEAEALEKLGVRISAPPAEGQKAGGRGKLVDAERLTKGRVFKTINKPIALKLDSAKNARGEPRLERSGAAGAAFLSERIPGIVRPEIYTIRETRPDGTTRTHAVAGDRGYKRWAVDMLSRSPGTRLEVTGVVMARAQGHEVMVSRGRNQEVQPVLPRVLYAASLDGLDTLKRMSAEGFLHGDMKSPNMFIDEKSRTLKFIDVDEIQKMRKGQNGVRLPALTPAYSHPSGLFGKVGFEQDLMGLAVSMLHTALVSRGRTEDAEKIKNGINTYNKKHAKSDAPGFMMLRRFIESCMPDDPSRVEIMAFNWIQAALDHSAPMAQRYDPEGDGDHLLDRIDPRLNPEAATRLDLRTNAYGSAPARQPQRPPAAPPDRAPARVAVPGGAARPGPVAAEPAKAPPESGVIARMIEREIDVVGVDLDRLVPGRRSIEISRAVLQWAESPEGRDEIAAYARGQISLRSDADPRRIREILIDRVNVEHLRAAVRAGDMLSGLPEAAVRQIEGRLSVRSFTEEAAVMTPEELAAKVDRIRKNLKI